MAARLETHVAESLRHPGFPVGRPQQPCGLVGARDGDHFVLGPIHHQQRLADEPLRPGDEISVANHKYTIQYQLPTGSTFEDVFAEEEDVFSQSLMEKAGLEKPRRLGGDRR